MKHLLYPKTYATLVEIRQDYPPRGCQKDWVFRTDADEIVVARNPGHSGHTPKRLRTKAREIYRSFSLKQKKTVPAWPIAYQGERFKLYRKPGIDRWFYRHMGQ